MASGFVTDTQRIGCSSNSSDLEIVQVVQEMFTQSPKMLILEAARESGLIFHWVQTAPEGA